jgi:hypothetical protein
MQLANRLNMSASDVTRCAIQLALLISLSLGCGRSANPPYSQLPTAQTIYSSALKNAQIANKPVFVVFTQDEFWCQQLDNFEADEDVARLLGKYFLLIHLRVDAHVGAEQLYYEHGSDRGVPAYAIIDPHGETLADSGDVGQNIGFPNSDDEVQRYLKMLKTACPEITDEEQVLLRNKLEARRVTDINNERTSQM